MIVAFADEDSNDIGGGYVTTIDGIGGDVFLCIEDFSIQLDKIEEHVRKQFPEIDGIVITDKSENMLYIEYGYQKISDMWYLEF